jgi:hypothetical protein
MTTSPRWDETWHRLREWTNGPTPSERLAAQILLSEGFTDLDPSHPLGGKDGGKDAICKKDGKRWVMAVYFPRGQKSFSDIKAKFDSDFIGVEKHNAQGFAFVTNQELRLSERKELSDLTKTCEVEIYHLEQLTAILDKPDMGTVRKQFLGIDFHDGIGGDGGSGTINGNNGTIIGGRGGNGGVSGIGGKGGDGFIQGDNGLIIGGDGGNCGTPDGRGGRGARSPTEREDIPTNMWSYGRGGSGENHPEYNRRIVLLKNIRLEYMDKFSEEVPFIEAGVDIVPINWVNKRLEELHENWRIEMGVVGYFLPPLLHNL